MKSLLVVAALAAAAPAFAQTKVARDAQTPTAAPVQRIDGFEDEEIGGNLLHPDGEAITGTLRVKHLSLVRARTTFVPELIKSAFDR